MRKMASGGSYLANSPKQARLGGILEARQQASGAADKHQTAVAAIIVLFQAIST